MKKLTEQDVIRMIREQWEKRVDAFIKESGLEIQADVDDDDKPETLISQDLKVRHKKSKIRYTVDSVSPRDVILVTPEGEQILVDKDEFESEYELD